MVLAIISIVQIDCCFGDLIFTDEFVDIEYLSTVDRIIKNNVFGWGKKFVTNTLLYCLGESWRPKRVDDQTGDH